MTLRGGAGRLAAVAVLVAGAVIGPWAAGPVRAAEDELALTSSASYRLDPEAGVVRVTVDVTATNNKPNLVRQTSEGTVTTRYFYDLAVLVVQSEATDIVARAGGSTLRTRVADEEGFKVVDVLFRGDLFYEQSTSFTLTYTLPGGPARSESDIRVGAAFATFYAWAFGDRGDVLITVPDGFEVQTTGSTIAEQDVESGSAFAASGISDVGEWFVVVTADRHEALTQERLDMVGGEELVVRAWPEDEAWRTQVGDLLKEGLPVLVEKIGLAWPVDGEIEVVEVHTPLLEGYAGVFYTDRGLIEISEDLDELTILHEASHAWFNQDLFVGRWINEGFADEYAARVVDEVSGGGLAPDPLTPASDGAVRLNDWSHPGRITDEETNAREHFGYEASWTVIRELVDEIGEDGMRRVLAAAEASTTAYAGDVEAEVVPYPTDWRRLLDLLEEVGESARADDLYRRWVVEAHQEATLDERTRARDAYGALVEEGDGWLPGYVVRDPLGRWQFNAAHEAIAEAGELLEVRDELREIGARLGVEVPASLEAAYEAADEDFDAVRALADRQLAAATAVDAAAAAVAAERDLLTSLGLLGEDPATGIATAKGAFAADETGAAGAEAARVAALIAGAEDAGRTRALVGGGLVAGVTALGIGGVALRRRRTTPAVAPEPDLEATRPYATLAGQRTDGPESPLTELQEPSGGPPPSPPPDREHAGGEDS